MSFGNNEAVPSGRSPWLIVAAKFAGLVIFPPMLVIGLWGVFGQVAPLGYAFWGLIALLWLRPQICNNLFGYTDKFPRLLLIAGLMPTALFAGVLLIATNEKSSPTMATTPAQNSGVSRQAPAVARATPTAPTPAALVKESPKAKPEGRMTWARNTLTNNTSKVLLGATLECSQYFKDGKLASESEREVAFVSDSLLLPVVPGESRRLDAEFKFSGNKDDIAKEKTACTVSAPVLVELNPSNLPVTVTLAVKKTENYSGDKVVASLSNTSGKAVSVSSLEIGCVVRQVREMTNEEMMDVMKYGNYTADDKVHKSRYYERLIARPYFSSDGDTKLEIPPRGKLDVRLYTKGGLFSSDKEVVASVDFTSQVCWILD